MQQHYYKTFLTLICQSVLGIALIVPVAFAVDKSKGADAPYRGLSRTSGDLAGSYNGLRGRRATDISGPHRKNSRNPYYGLSRNRDQQKQAEVKTKYNKNSRADKKTDARQSDRQQNNRASKQTISNDRLKDKYGKHPDNAVYHKETNKKQVDRSNRLKDKYGKHPDYDRQHKTPDNKHAGTSNYKKYKNSKYYDQTRYYRNHKKHKKYMVKKRPVSRVFFIGYSYVPYSYYSYYDHYYPGIYSYNAPAYYSYRENTYSSGTMYENEGAGWSLLAQGQISAALDSFTREMEYFPNAGIPKVGYSIAVAVAGDLTKAVLAMREALRYDPDSLQYIYLDYRVLNLIDDLIEKYEYPLQYNNRRPDEAFMVSALYYLKQDYISAHDALGRAIADGDKSLSVNNLNRIINAKLQENFAGDYN